MRIGETLIGALIGFVVRYFIGIYTASDQQALRNLRSFHHWPHRLIGWSYRWLGDRDLNGRELYPDDVLLSAVANRSD